MSKYFVIVMVLGGALGLQACGFPKVPKTDVPEFKMPEIKLPFKETCSKPEAQQTISAEAVKNTIVIEDEVPTKDIEYVLCSGEVIKKHGPVRFVESVIDITAPLAFEQEVSAVEIENSRTCTKIRTATWTDQTMKSEIIAPGGIQPNFIGTLANKSGLTKVFISDSEIQMLNILNVVDGANAVQIRYFGRCLEFDPKDPKTCAKAELLATKDLLIKVSVKRPETPGVDRKDVCSKEKEPKGSKQ